MIKKFDEFIIESNEQYILYIKLSESDPKLKDNIEKIIEIGQEDNKTVLTKHNTDAKAFIWGYESFLYPFFERDEAESFISEISNLMDIYEYNIFPATDKNPLMKYFLK
jgi:hypothetical protein